METKIKYAYGSMMEVAPTFGIDCLKGEILIVGIMSPNNLPDDISIMPWLTGDPKADYETETEPWYFFEYTDQLEDITHNLPQWALEDVVHKANTNKVKNFFK